MKSDRIYLRVDPRLKREVAKWARAHNTSLSAVVTRFLLNLMRHEQAKTAQDTDVFNDPI